MPYEWIIAASGPNAPDFGDETEYDYIMGQGYEEAEQFGGIAYVHRLWGDDDTDGVVFRPAKWLNPPHKVVMAADYD